MLSTTARTLVAFSALTASLACTTAVDTPSTSNGDTSVAAVTLSTTGASLAVGATMQLSAAAKTANGALLSGRIPAWSSSDAAIAAVTAGGLVTAVAPGTAFIEATIEQKTGSARIDVYSAPTGNATISVNPAQRFQTMRGWEAGSQWGLDNPLRSSVATQIIDRAANELGIDRLRVPLRSGVENPRDWYADMLSGAVPFSEYRCHWYESINDNDDPFTLNPAGFHFTELDQHVDETVVPLRQRLQARGESVYMVLSYVANTVQNCNGTTFHHQGQEYGELLLAAFQHMHDKYGFVPDAVELVNEPDASGWQFGMQPLAGMLSAAATRLQAAGFTPDFMAPSTTSAANAVTYYRSLIGTAGNADAITELSYHRYGGGLSDLQAIGDEAQAHGIAAVMGEKLGAGVQQLYEDLTIADAAAWEQETLGFYTYPGWSDNGTTHYWIDYSNAAAPTITMGSRSRLLSEYFRYVRRGAVRIGATSANEAWRPTAFINTNGGYVVVVWTTQGGSFTIGGLPAGTYGVNYAAGSDYNVEGTAITLHAGESMPVTIPGAGVITVYAK